MLFLARVLLIVRSIIKFEIRKKNFFGRFLVVLCCLVIGVICTIGEYEERITQKFIYVVNFEREKKLNFPNLIFNF
jgi:hypothetical protein